MADYRYRKLGYLALNVTDLDRSTAFYRDMVGLSVTEEQPGEIALLRCTDQHHEIVLYPAETAGVKRMAFQMESSEDLDAAGGGVAGAGHCRGNSRRIGSSGAPFEQGPYAIVCRARNYQSNCTMR